MISAMAIMFVVMYNLNSAVRMVITMCVCVCVFFIARISLLGMSIGIRIIVSANVLCSLIRRSIRPHSRYDCDWYDEPSSYQY